MRFSPFDRKRINLTRGFERPYVFLTKRKDHNNGLLTCQPKSYWHTLFNTVVSWNTTLQYAKNATWAKKLLHQIQVFTSKPNISAHRSSTIQSKSWRAKDKPNSGKESSIKTLIMSSSWPWFNLLSQWYLNFLDRSCKIYSYKPVTNCNVEPIILIMMFILRTRWWWSMWRKPEHYVSYYFRFLLRTLFNIQQKTAFYITRHFGLAIIFVAFWKPRCPADHWSLVPHL